VANAVDYTDVTEARGDQITRQALEMMCTRYAFAARFCDGRDVLEVACGAGQGLGMLRRHARHVIGGDYTPRLLDMARAHYGSRIPLVRLDGELLPFGDASVDVVILYEALYYLRDARAFVREARRILRPGGKLIICTVNREWADFNPSPFSQTYHSAAELRALLNAAGFESSLLGAFPVEDATVTDQLVSLVKRSAVALGLMPKTMRGKRLFKRIFLGRLVPFPAEIRDGIAPYREPVPLQSGSPANTYKVLYAVGAV
jgi:ubiquinone/menaquinone biosynthesis C-methylase UbiE